MLLDFICGERYNALGEMGSIKKKLCVICGGDFVDDRTREKSVFECMAIFSQWRTKKP